MHNCNTKYFFGATTVEEIKARYRRLAMDLHPDRGGDAEAMKVLNREYHEALRRCHGTTAQKTAGGGEEEHTYYYNEAVEQAVIDKLAELLGLSLPNIRVMLVGTWIWIDGETKPVRDSLKSHGLRWHNKRGKWYWHAGSHRYRQSLGDFNELAAKYGYREFESNKRQKLEA
ncbi:J domain-containing protein [Nodosilinea nodulosa]|uniref:J domain-containing protein n=1 Tax=Nodosilinea nodulosa TaxID=416001 RepID=UPI00035F14AF|nr:J domain-containing protein [Nodosilinea nodulosa]